MKQSGVYQIRNLINNKVYIGSSKNIKSRRRDHLYYLRHGQHNRYLQQDWNKYGENNFIFEVLLECSDDRKTLLAEEQKLLDKIKPEYNIFIIAYSPGDRPAGIPTGTEYGAKTWTGLVSPDGVEYRNIKNLTKFCRERNLGYDAIRGIVKGQTINSKTGWKRLKDESINEDLINRRRWLKRKWKKAVKEKIILLQ
jgi:group I intron endonuclease